MSTTGISIETLTGTRFGLIADAHIHAGEGPILPPAVRRVFDGADGIIALGDMGDAAGLDELEALAPLLCVRGADDAPDDPRVNTERRLFSHGDHLIGAVFDGTRHGLFVESDPLAVVPEFAAAASAAFGRPISVLLCAASHKPLLAWSHGILIVNPGSPTLAERCTIALLHLDREHVIVEHLTIRQGQLT